MKINHILKNYFKTLINSLSGKNVPSESRRLALSKLLATGGAVALGASASTANAHKIDTAEEKDERFPGDPPQHFIVYQLNESEHEYHQHVLNSVGAMIGRYEDNIDIVVACFGKGIHVLAKEPGRPVHDSIKEKIESLAGQGVKFHACGRTLKSMKWTEKDMLPFAKMVEVGVADIMELQEQNYAYFSW
ncbi:MAG: hypothetical protein GQ546_11345 [Gammaproteobacteria bacterium]|nr:hypothetical protein [Gammaproteobacteria bacterium]